MQKDRFIPNIKSFHEGKSGDTNLTGVERSRDPNLHQVSSFQKKKKQKNRKISSSSLPCCFTLPPSKTDFFKYIDILQQDFGSKHGGVLQLH